MSRPVPTHSAKIVKQARGRIARIRDSVGTIDYLCSGTLAKRMKLCGKPSCRCAQDPTARHGPYYEWGHMHDGKLVHRTVTPEQAAIDVDRRIGWPGQGYSYQVGQLEIRRLRTEAERQLGAKFDVGAFHDRVLEDGTITLPMLRDKIARWLAAST